MIPIAIPEPLLKDICTHCQMDFAINDFILNLHLCESCRAEFIRIDSQAKEVSLTPKRPRFSIKGGNR